MNAVYFDPWSNLRYEPDPSPADDPNLLWFNSDVNPDDVLEASEHRTHFEYSVDGKKRIKPGSKHTTVGTKTTVNGKTIAIFKQFGRLYAINNVCPHQRGELHLGDIEEINKDLFSLDEEALTVHMGITHSKSAALRPQNDEPAIIFQTDTGVIVRTPDPLAPSGPSRYDFNPRYVPPDSAGASLHPVDGPTRQILTVKRGAQNPSMKDKLVYAKVPPRGIQPHN